MTSLLLSAFQTWEVTTVQPSLAYAFSAVPSRQGQ